MCLENMAWNSSLKEGSGKQCWSFLLTSTASYQSDGLLRLLKTNSFLILTKMSHNHNHTVSSQLKHLSKGFIVSFLENSFSPAHTHLAHLSVEVGYPSSWVKKYKRGPFIPSHLPLTYSTLHTASLLLVHSVPRKKYIWVISLNSLLTYRNGINI